MEENHRSSDSLASAPKSSGSPLVQINSIAIDLVVEEIEPPAIHDHFSIRGFVSDMRKKDPKICSTFASEKDDGEVDDPPLLDVPKFRWWKCSNCVPEISSLSIISADKNGAGTSFCKNLDGADVLLLQNGEKIGGNEDAINITNKDGNLGDDMTESNNQLQIYKERDENSPDAYDTIAECTIDEPDNSLFGNNGTLSTTHRRKPKLRKLADIMEEERNSKIEHPTKRSSFSNGKEIVLAPPQVPEGSRSPPRKRKMVLEEEKGPSEKRSKGLNNFGADKTFGRFETSNLELEGDDASTRLNFRLGEKSHLKKPTKNKGLETVKKTRPPRIDNGPGQTSKINSANLQNRAVFSVETSFPRNDGSSLGENVPFVTTFPGSNLSKSKGPEENQGPLLPPNKSNLGDNNKGKDRFDLSMNSSKGAERNSENRSCFRQQIIPDLNETFTHQTSTNRGKKLPNLFKKRSFPSDFPASSSRDIAREGKRPVEFSEPQNVQKADNNVEPSDDIPMEIIELLAKNKRERELQKSRNNFLPMGINNSIGGSTAPYADGLHPSTINFPPANTRTGFTMERGNMGIPQSFPVDFPGFTRYPMGRVEESQFKLFAPFPPRPEKNTQFSGPIPREGGDLLWPPRRENASFNFPPPRNHAIPSNGIGINTFPGSHKGKTISDIKSVEEKHLLKEMRNNGPGPDYSNETIPAMQLLSLMNYQGIGSGPSVNMGPKSYLDKPFSPCNHHPRVNKDENQKFLGGSFFSQNSHSKDLFGLGRGVYSSGESSKKGSTYLQGQVNPWQGSSKGNVIMRPPINNSSMEICVLNRNPADFSIPDARNEFTISAKDLKPRKPKGSRGRPRLVNLDGQKTQRMRKNDQGKEFSRN